MASRKRARTSSIGGSSSSSATAPTITLNGGEACPTKQVALWRSGRLTDTVVEVDGRSFAAHRLVLAAACDYFERHYDHEHLRDAEHPKLLEHVTAAAFEPLLSFLYEGACSFDESLLAPVLRAAHYLGVPSLESAAVAALTERISPSNALTAWTWGEELGLPELAKAAKVTALEGFDEVEKIEEATLVQVQSLVADDRLTAKSEEVVFSAVARFAEAKQPAEADLLELLRNVRFPLMSRPFLLETVRKWPMLQTVAGQGMLVEMLAPNAGPAQQPRAGFGGRFLYVMGGAGNDQEPLSSVEIYDTLTNTWAATTPLPTARTSGAAAVLGGKIYALRGQEEGHEDDEDDPGEDDPPTDAVDVFDPQTCAWATGVPMTTARHCLATAVVGGKLYAIGGNTEGQMLPIVEAFDPQTGAWAEMAPMPTARSAPGVAVLNGKIYVTGGFSSERDSVNTVEVYDPQTNTWATAPPMSEKRRVHGVAALGGKIYAAGGLGDDGPPTSRGLSSVEVFDPQTNSWSAVAPMRAERWCISLTAVRGKLYAVGGCNDTADSLATVEAYDPQQDRWEAVLSMTCARRAAAVVSMC